MSDTIQGELAEKVALVTGARYGIGRVIGKQLARKGRLSPSPASTTALRRAPQRCSAAMTILPLQPGTYLCSRSSGISRSDSKAFYLELISICSNVFVM